MRTLCHTVSMVMNGDSAELNSNALFSMKLVENREYLMESRYQKELESAFQESYRESHEETIASAEPVKESQVADWKEILTIVVGVISVMAAGFSIIWYRRKKQ